MAMISPQRYLSCHLFKQTLCLWMNNLATDGLIQIHVNDLGHEETVRRHLTCILTHHFAVLSCLLKSLSQLLIQIWQRSELDKFSLQMVLIEEALQGLRDKFAHSHASRAQIYWNTVFFALDGVPDACRVVENVSLFKNNRVALLFHLVSILVLLWHVHSVISHVNFLLHFEIASVLVMRSEAKEGRLQTRFQKSPLLRPLELKCKILLKICMPIGVIAFSWDKSLDLAHLLHQVDLLARLVIACEILPHHIVESLHNRIPKQRWRAKIQTGAVISVLRKCLRRAILWNTLDTLRSSFLLWLQPDVHSLRRSVLQHL